jgi:hypothetical protein
MELGWPVMGIKLIPNIMKIGQLVQKLKDDMHRLTFKQPVDQYAYFHSLREECRLDQLSEEMATTF